LELEPTLSDLYAENNQISYDISSEGEDYKNNTHGFIDIIRSLFNTALQNPLLAATLPLLIVLFLFIVWKHKKDNEDDDSDAND